MYRPKGAFSNGKSGTEEKFGDFSNKALSILTIIPQDMLSNSWVTNYHEVSGPSGQSVNGPILFHPFEQREEKGPAQKIRYVFQFCACNGYV